MTAVKIAARVESRDGWGLWLGRRYWSVLIGRDGSVFYKSKLDPSREERDSLGKHVAHQLDIRYVDKARDDSDEHLEMS